MYFYIHKVVPPVCLGFSESYFCFKYEMCPIGYVILGIRGSWLTEKLNTQQSNLTGCAHLQCTLNLMAYQRIKMALTLQSQ